MKTLQRVAFKTSRLLEFCSERELTAQTGHGKADWPLVIEKELVDNALDGCEEAETAPKIDIEVDAGKRLTLIRRAEDIMEQDPPLVPVAWENILDVWYSYVKGHNPKDYFGIYDVVREDTFWLDKA